MKHYLRCALLLSAAMVSPLPAIGQAEQPLVVRLSTEQQLQPIFLARFSNQDSGLDSRYVEQLEQILHFDLAHSGYFQLLPQTPQRSSLANSSNLSQPGIAQQWRALNALYVIKLTIQPKSMQAALLSVNENAIKKIEGFSLSGNLSQDRAHIHRLADALIKMITGAQGVASTHLIFTHKYFDSAKNKWHSDLWESDYDGGNARKILGEESGYSITPVYIPAKQGHKTSAFFYVSYKNGQPKIYLAKLSDGSSQRLTSLRGNQLMPAISKQRDKLAFISDITGNPDLFLQEFNPERGLIGKPRQIFTTRQATQGTPTFSPDGQRIAFVSNKDGHPRIYVMPIPAPGTQLKDIKPRLISQANRESSAPSWSPDGTKLAYCAKNNGARQIWIYHFDTGEEWQLTEGYENKENPSWAPDSLHLVYNTTDNSNADLFMVNLNDRTPVKISPPLKGELRFPSWEPR